MQTASTWNPLGTGRTQSCDGVRYYSPNSLVDSRLCLDPQITPILESNPFQPGRSGDMRVRYREFTFPRRWSESFGWISFIPVVPSQWYGDPHSFLGRALSQLPPIKKFVDPRSGTYGYQVSPSNAWADLECNIYKAVLVLSRHYNIQCVLPFLPNAVGYLGMYVQKRQLKRRLEEGREWFFVWFGALSYLIASVRNPRDNHLKAQLDHQWCSVLLSRGVSPTFVDGLQCSLCVNSQPEIRRAGVIVDVYTPLPGQPHPFWFVEQGVPVWYRRGDAKEQVSQLFASCRLFSPSSPQLSQPAPPENDFPAGPNPSLQVPITSTPEDQRDGRRRSREFQTLGPQTLVEGTSAPVSLATSTPSTHLSQRSPTNPDHTPSDKVSSSRSGGTSQTPYQAATALPVASLASDHPKLTDQPGRGRADEGIQAEPEWVGFFNSREQKYAQLLQTETPRARQTRENRIRAPATSSAKVFEWYPSDTPGISYERLPVPAKARSEVLQQYGERQKRYDPVANEWDCCDAWGPDDDEEDEEDPEDEGSEQTPIPPVVASSFVSVAESPDEASSYAEGDHPTNAFMDDSREYESLTDYVDEAFGLFYGFNYLLPRVTHPLTNYTEREKSFFLRLVGLDQGSVPSEGYRYFHPDNAHHHAAQQLLLSLSRRQTPQYEGSWDLDDQSVNPVRLSHRFKRIRVIHLGNRERLDDYDKTEKYYVFENYSEDVLSWRLGVTSAANALLVCRLPKDHTAHDLAVFLVQHGVPFRTFYPFSNISRFHPRHPIVHRIPERPLDHTFTKEDYNAYIHMRSLLLGQSHMQAALKRGGIVWRLAVGTLGITWATSPPSLWGASHAIVVSGEQFVDDMLTTTELDLICGAYECISEDGKQRSLKSWWPLVRYYEKDECGENYGRWTPRRESWYAKRLDGIEASDPKEKPLTYTEWKSSQHGPKPIRTFHTYIEHSSCQLIESHGKLT